VKKLWSEFKYWIFILIFLAILFELVASMILFRKYTPAKSAALHIISNLFKKAGAEQYSYEPWLMFRLSDYQSDSININGFERKSVPGTFIKPGSADTVDIYFFGGNTMFGQHLSDSETIPSRFVKAYQNENPSTSVRVKNFGIPHYYSKQELMLLTSLLFKGDRPDIAVFLDGLSDFYPAHMLYYDRPFFSYALQQSFEGKMFQKGNGSFVDSTEQFYDDPAGISAGDYNNALIAKYRNNIRMAANLCKAAGIKSYFFCQPVPFYKNSQGGKQYKGNYKRFEYIYPELEKNKDPIANFYFLGNMNENEKEKHNQEQYVDELNYTPAFADKIAKQILNTIKNDLHAR
jgi:hypothetical protein